MPEVALKIFCARLPRGMRGSRSFGLNQFMEWMRDFEYSSQHPPCVIVIR
jgi:hypothetical protein